MAPLTNNPSGSLTRGTSKRRFQGGQLIVEVLVAFGLASILLPALLGGFVTAVQGREIYEQRLAATALLREGEEALRSIRNEDWGNIATNGTYYPAITGTKWILSTNASDGEVNGFTRVAQVSDFIRSGSVDPSTKTIVITVSWAGILSRSVSSTIYLTRWSNTSFPSTAQGTLIQQGFGNWCKPALAATNIDLIRQGFPTAVSAFESANGTGNRVFTGTGANASGPAFSNIVITGNNPPTAASVTDYSGTPQIKANGVYGDSTNYAFLASDNKGVVILNLASTPYVQVGSFNPNGMKPANSVYVVGNTGYVVTDDKFYIFSVSADRTTTAQIGVLALADGARVVVDGSNQYAYVPNPDANGELKIIDVHTNPATLTSADVKNVDVNGGAGRDVFINTNTDRAYLATAASLTQPEFFIIDITDKANPQVLPATYDTNGMDPKGVRIVSAMRAVIAGSGGHEYQVFSVVGDAISFCPNHGENDDYLDIDAGVYAVSSILQADGHAYSYIVTADANAELKIIEGGPGGEGGGGGTFEGPVFDAGKSVIFNSFSVTSTEPSGITSTYQVAISANCSTYNFVGPDGTSTTSFGDTGGIIPISVNPGQCFKYRVTFTGGGEGITNASSTVSVNYSP